MKNLITLYQKYRNHFMVTLGIITTIMLGVLTVMVFFGHVLPPICIWILMISMLLNVIETTLEAIENIRYGEDEYECQDNIAQIVINIDTDEMDIHEVIEKINKALNGEEE